jgi:hypothetical protein
MGKKKKPKRTRIKFHNESREKLNRMLTAQSLGIRMFECFGRTSIDLTSDNMRTAKKLRKLYLEKFGKNLDLRKQTLSEEDKKCLAIK